MTCRGGLCLAVVVLLLCLCNLSLGVALQVDIGTCYGATPQPGWLGLEGCRTNYNVGGTLIDFSVEVGFGPDSSACECRKESGATHELMWVHQTFIKQDGANPQPPNSDMVFTLSDLTPGAEYNLLTYHDYWDASDNVIDSITVTGATNVTQPSSILQNHDFAPGTFTFTAGSGDVVIRYSCLSGGQPYFNGFELYGGGVSMQFGSATSGELETETSVDIPVTINGPNESETYTVNYAVIGGTATGGGEDYTLDSGTLTFLPGSSVEFITIDINDDSEHEDDETVVIELSSPGGPEAVLGSPTQHTYTIIDPRPDVLFWRASGSGMENVTPAYAPLRLTRPTRNTVTVNYTVTGGTATGGGVDYLLSAGTVLFDPNQTNGNIPIAIVSDSNDAEHIETIIIELSSPTNAHLGSQIEYTHTIVSQPIDIQVDFALPYCPPDNDIVRPETAKPGWWTWAAPKWYDMYSHDAVWEDGTGSKPSDSGIDETGIHAGVTLLREGDLGLKVSGLVMPNLDGGCPTSSPIYEPICNSWLQAVDWPTPDSGYGSIQLVLYELPAGAYALYSYHNHFGCYRGSPVRCDCICNVVPPMPVIKAMSGKDAYELPYTQGSFSKLFPGYNTDALPEGVVSIQDACNVQPQQVTTDAELVPSVIRFATDGSPVLVLYQGGCCAEDPVREDRVGGRGILNAFRLVSIDDVPFAYGPVPGNGDEDVPPDTTMSWQPGLYMTTHDVYFGTDFDEVRDANTTVTLGVYVGRQDACEYDPVANLELGQTYYWRIDELNGVNIWQGQVWSFTAINYAVVDDMEEYTGTSQGEGDYPLDKGWTDYFANGTGSALFLRTSSPVRDEQSMEYWYCNSRVGSLGYYSESKSLDLNPTDWASSDAKMLSLCFYGDPGNSAEDTEQMYVGLEDSSDLYAELRYGDNEGEDMDNIKIEDWQEWNMPLTYFSDSNFAAVPNDVNLADVNTLFIGFGIRGGLVQGGDGVVYFDDIRLYSSRCIPQYGPPADFTGDCIVSFQDYAILANQWRQAPGIPSADIAPESPDGVVDWLDLAILVDSWLDERLWPESLE